MGKNFDQKALLSAPHQGMSLKFWDRIISDSAILSHHLEQALGSQLDSRKPLNVNRIKWQRLGFV